MRKQDFIPIDVYTSREKRKILERSKDIVGKNCWGDHEYLEKEWISRKERRAGGVTDSSSSSSPSLSPFFPSFWQFIGKEKSEREYLCRVMVSVGVVKTTDSSGFSSLKQIAFKEEQRRLSFAVKSNWIALSQFLRPRPNKTSVRVVEWSGGRGGFKVFHPSGSRGKSNC